LRYAKRALIVLAIVAMTLFATRVYFAERGDPLEPWRTYVLHELSVRELDKTDCAGYLKAEDAIFESSRREVTQRLPELLRVPSNPFFSYLLQRIEYCIPASAR
jgi:hypothetical protein